MRLISILGGLAVGIPGELAGYWAAHQRFGRLNWARLVIPAANLVDNGIAVNQHMANALIAESALIKAAPSMKYIFLLRQNFKKFKL